MTAFGSGAGKRPYGTSGRVVEPVVRLEKRGRGSVHVVLNRPDVRNAFDADTIALLHRTFAALSRDDSVRTIVLSGAGRSFCAGADIGSMHAALDLTASENVRDAERMADMFAAIDACPKPVIAKIHGAALGGGAGLAAVCDIVVAETRTQFGFTETKLGIIPAVISPFVLAKIGVSAARALFLSGERFSAAHAQRIGLIHEVCVEAELDARIEVIEVQFATAAPTAVTAAKRLISEVSRSDRGTSRALTAEAIATQRTSPEGQAGLRAFLERRPPPWVEPL